MVDPGQSVSRHKAATAVAHACATLAESGLVNSSSGNVSIRVGEEMVITPRRGRLESIEPPSCCRIRIDDGSEIKNGKGDWSPSSETPLHLAVYRAVDAGAVVHTHSAFATAASTVIDELPPIHYLMAAFGGPVRVAPYATFGSDELAASVADALRGRRGALLRNHGVVVYSDDIEGAVDLAHQIEWMSKVFLISSAHGEPALLDQGELDRVAERAENLQYGIGGQG